MKTYSYDVHTPEHENALYNFMQDLSYAGWGRMFAGEYNFVICLESFSSRRQRWTALC